MAPTGKREHMSRATRIVFRGIALCLGSMLWLAGCYPAFRTVQPKVDLVVVDTAGRPIEGATLTLATYRYPRAMPGTTQFARYETDAAGTASIPRRGDWQMEILLPDGSSWYGWRYCVEKAGYRAIASAETRKFRRPLTVVLEPRQGSSKCKWPGEGESYYKLEIVENE
jgi:hypothetical protein